MMPLAPSGMVMRLIPLATVTPWSDGNDTSDKRRDILRQEDDHDLTYMHGPLLTKEPCLGYGSHLSLHRQGCFATCATITETPSRCTLLFDLKD